MSVLSPSRQLLVNADDFGLSSAINNGIVAALTEGIVRSTSIVASGDAFDEAIDQARANPQLGVGVHLTLVEEAAIAPSATIPTLAPQGMLPPKYGALIKAVATGHIGMLDIEREFRAQIEKCLAVGLTLTHLDSHQHTHAFPAIFKLVLRLGNEYRIPGIRIPRDRPRLSQRSVPRFLPKCALCVLAHGDAMLFARGGSITTQHFAGLFETGDLTQQALLNIFAKLKPGTTELVCHPGQPDASGKYTNWNERRQTELATLTSPTIRKAVGDNRIELISYRELCDDSANTAGCAA